MPEILDRVLTLIDWEPLYELLCDSASPTCRTVTLLRAMVLQRFLNLSGVALDDALTRDPYCRSFVGLLASANVGEQLASLNRLREDLGVSLCARLVSEIDRQIEASGLVVGLSALAIANAPIRSAAPKPSVAKHAQVYAWPQEHTTRVAADASLEDAPEVFMLEIRTRASAHLRGRSFPR